MSVTTVHAPGTFCWLDLAAHDPEAAKRFYSAFFGWEADDRRYGPGENDVYTMYRLDGRDVGASYAMDPGQKAQGMPSAWLSYVAVESADESARRAAELGGTVMAEPFDVMEVGRMALVTDPTGALFALWQPKSHPGVGVRDEPGALCWTELATTDPQKAGEFYGGLFGWTGQPFEGGPVPYTMYNLPDGTPAGGIYPLMPEMQMPPSWMPYFAVADVDAAAEKARDLGARVLVEPTDIPQVGRFIMIQDPQGAMFYAIRLEEMPQSS